MIASSCTQWTHPTERPPLAHLLEIGGRRLGKQQRVAVAHQLLAGAQAADQALELRVADAEGRAVVALEEDPPPQVGVELCEMGRMDRQPTLVLLARAGDDSEAEVVHRTRMGGKLA